MGEVDQAVTVFDKLWPEARVISDPEKKFYREFGLKRVTSSQLFHPGSFVRAMGAFLKGNSVSTPKGQDPLMMGGVFFLRGQELVWVHNYRHTGDHPDFARIPDLVAGAQPN